MNYFIEYDEHTNPACFTVCEGKDCTNTNCQRHMNNNKDIYSQARLQLDYENYKKTLDKQEEVCQNTKCQEGTGILKKFQKPLDKTKLMR